MLAINSNPPSNKAKFWKHEKISSSESLLEKVLLVEDEPDLLETAAIVFESLGFEVLRAGNAAAALSMLEQNTDVSLVFTDVMMPGGMNGFELAHVIEGKYPHMKIMLASGYAIPALNRESKAGQQHILLQKPYYIGDIVKSLRELNLKTI